MAVEYFNCRVDENIIYLFLYLFQSKRIDNNIYIYIGCSKKRKRKDRLRRHFWWSNAGIWISISLSLTEYCSWGGPRSARRPLRITWPINTWRQATMIRRVWSIFWGIQRIGNTCKPKLETMKAARRPRSRTSSTVRTEARACFWLTVPATLTLMAVSELLVIGSSITRCSRRSKISNLLSPSPITIWTRALTWWKTLLSSSYQGLPMSTRFARSSSTLFH